MKAKAYKKDVDALLKKELNWEQVNDKLEPYDVYIDGPVQEEGKTMFLARLAVPKADSQEKDLTQPVEPVKTADGAASDETHPLKNTDADDKENEFHKLEEENNAALAEKTAIQHAPQPQEEALHGVASDETQPPKDIDTAANDDGNPVYDPENYEYVPLDEEDAGEEEAANGPQPMES